MVIDDVELTLRSSTWPDATAAPFLPKDDWYGKLALILHEGFPNVETHVVTRLSIATQCLARSLIVADKLVDQDDTNFAPGDLIHGAIALQYKAQRALQRIFAYDDPFWRCYEDYFETHIRGVLSERKLFADPTHATHATLLASLRDRNRLHCGVLAAFTALSGEPERLPQLEVAMDAFCTSLQLVDDVHDWKCDIQRRRPTVVNVQGNIFARVATGTLALADASRQLFFDGLAEEIILSAIDSAKNARILAEAEGLHGWAIFIDTRILAFEQFFDRIAKARQSQISWHRQNEMVPSKAEPLLPNAPEPIAVLVENLIESWTNGYGELRHLMFFPAKAGFGGRDELKKGDLFQRLLVLDTLSEANALFGQSVRMSEVIDRESRLLLDSSERDPVLGRVWKYFPDLPELPADADDLAEIVRLFVRMRRHEIVDPSIESAIQCNLATLFENPSLDAPETWIIPNRSSDDVHQRQRHCVEVAWGTGDDVEVVANLLDALYEYVPAEAQGTFSKFGSYFEDRQSASGFWASNWYVGPYYGTYAVARSLARFFPDPSAARAASRAAEWLMASQHACGGWAIAKNEPDPLSTSLALLALDHLRPHANAINHASRAVAWLALNANDPTVTDFIKMHIPAGATGQPRILQYGSRTLTKSFVVRALTRWHSVNDIV